MSIVQLIILSRVSEHSWVGAGKCIYVLLMNNFENTHTFVKFSVSLIFMPIMEHVENILSKI